MCGIAGAINLRLDTAAVQQSLRHRGPDAAGAVRVGKLELIHTRLAIVDQSGGAQPMQRGPLTLCYNGELYNHQALRERYRLDCRTQSDTETLLALYERQGRDCLDALDGMFAFALHDARDNSLWLVRDRAGEKPLYVWQDSVRALAFASELNALASMVPLEVDHATLADYFASGLVTGEHSVYRQVRALPPGSAMTVDVQTLNSDTRRWFSIGECFGEPGQLSTDRHQALEALDSTLALSVKRQLLSSDVPVGAFLSGGIDSGLVTALAAQHTARLNTFTVAFDGQFDETPLALEVAKRYGTHHEVLDVDYRSLPEHIESIVGNYGRPTADDSIIPTWYVSRAAKRHVTVVLTGDGADEQFAGYRRYVPYAHMPLFRPEGEALPWLGAMHRRIPQPQRKQSLHNYLWRLLALVSTSGIARYLASTTMIDARLLAEPPPLTSLRSRYAALAISPYSSLARLMMMDFDTLLAGGLTTKMDIGAMAHSLEARSPFLSVDVLRLAASFDDRLKIRGRTTKALLRDLAARYLPETVCQAPKRGFETPLTTWVDERLKAPMHDVLAPADARVKAYCVADRVNALLAGRLPEVSPLQRARLLWLLYTAEVWLRRQSHQGLNRELCA